MIKTCTLIYFSPAISEEHSEPVISMYCHHTSLCAILNISLELQQRTVLLLQIPSHVAFHLQPGEVLDLQNDKISWCGLAILPTSVLQCTCVETVEKFTLLESRDRIRGPSICFIFIM